MGKYLEEATTPKLEDGLYKFNVKVRVHGKNPHTETYSIRQSDLPKAQEIGYFRETQQSYSEKDIEETAKYLRRIDLEISGEYQTLSQKIKQRGGIAPSRTGAMASEYKETIPLHLKNKQGLVIDEMADEFGMTASDLLRIVSEEQKNRVGKVSDYYDKAIDYLEEYSPEASKKYVNYYDWKPLNTTNFTGGVKKVNKYSFDQKYAYAHTDEQVYSLPKYLYDRLGNKDIILVGKRER